MKNRLRMWRIALAAVFFLLITAAAAGFQPLDVLLVTQFGPGLLRLTSGLFAGALAAVIAILLMTLLFGRMYCSVLCPLGILQDIIAAVRRKRTYRFCDTRLLKYGVFLCVVILAAAGVMLPLVLLLPSSNFFTIVSNVFLRAAGSAANAAGVSVGSYTVNPPALAFFVSLGLFALISVLAVWRGRIYCNTLCPVGALLSIPAKYSLYRITLSQEQCVSCGQCEKACKSGAIDAKNKRVLNENCVMCFNCVSACRLHGVKLEFRPKSAPEFSLSRREFLGGIGGAAAGAGALLLTRKLERSMPGASIPPAMPPGAGSLARFNTKCVGCGICIRECDGKVLAPSISEYGLAGFMQPYMDYSRGFCTFSCNKCTTVCPAGAILPLPLPVKQTTRIGLASFDPTKCVAFLTGNDCGACAEHCPAGALDMIPFKETHVPRVNQDLCIGCGACQHICPVKPVPAITVEGLEEQIRVEKPQTEESQTLKAEEDFPF